MFKTKATKSCPQDREAFYISMDKNISSIMSANSDNDFEFHLTNFYSLIKQNIDLHTMFQSKLSLRNIFEAICYEISIVSKSCLPAAIGLAMHYYPLCAISTYPLNKLSIHSLARKSIVNRLCKEKAIVGNTGGKPKHLESQLICARKTKEGLILNGKTPYFSIACIANYVFLQANIDNSDEKALCLLPVKSPGASLCEYHFNGTMKLTATSSLILKDCFIKKNDYVINNDTLNNQSALE